MRLRENGSIAIRLTRMTVNITKPSATIVAQWTMGQQEPTELGYSEACHPERLNVAYCNTFSFCMTGCDSLSKINLLYSVFASFAVALSVLLLVGVSYMHSVQWRLHEWCPYGMNQSIYARHWLQCTPRDGLWAWLQATLFTLWENQPFKLGSSLCEWCVSVWSVGLWHTAAQLRRGEMHTARWGFEISEPFICRPQDSASSSLLRSGFVFFVFGVDLQLLVFPRSPHAVKRLREERPEDFMERRNKSDFNGPHLSVVSRLNIFPVLINSIFWKWSPSSPKLQRRIVALRKVEDFRCLLQAWGGSVRHKGPCRMLESNRWTVQKRPKTTFLQDVFFFLKKVFLTHV